jgi:large subunit ribosomal protein L15
MKIESIKTYKPGKKLGRGMGSGVGGHTTGRGGKGQTARGGHKSPRPGFEGGQNPISRRLPKLKGFTRSFIKSRQKSFALKLSILEKFVLDNKVDIVDVHMLLASGLIKSSYSRSLSIKILFDKNPEIALNVIGIPASAKAKEAIISKGGSIN